MAVLLGSIDKNKYGAYKSVYDLIDNKLKDVYQFMIINTN